MDHHNNRRFPANPKDYKLYEEVGEGVSATVYRALCIPLNEIVAIKVLDLEKCNNDLVCDIFRSAVGNFCSLLVSDYIQLSSCNSLFILYPSL